jgi:large subunit ribosomal protein L18
MAIKIVRTKKDFRLRRAAKTRALIKRLAIETGVLRLTIHRSNQHIYGQIINANGRVLAQASTLELRGKAEWALKKTEKATQVGVLLAQRSLEAGIASVACDRSGFLYHGRVAALVNGLRENGVSV